MTSDVCAYKSLYTCTLARAPLYTEDVRRLRLQPAVPTCHQAALQERPSQEVPAVDLGEEDDVEIL